MTDFPRGRPHTTLPPGLAATLTVTPKTEKPVPLALRQDAWLQAKELQRLENGSFARIAPDRLARLEEEIRKRKEAARLDQLGTELTGKPLAEAGSIEASILTANNQLCARFGRMLRKQGAGQ